MFLDIQVIYHMLIQKKSGVPLFKLLWIAIFVSHVRVFLMSFLKMSSVVDKGDSIGLYIMHK